MVTTEGIDAGAVGRALEAMAHRGPDGAGVVVAADRAAALGHVRLAVIDVAGGAQPITSEDGRVHIAVNGALYDHDDARAALEARGHRFRTRSDSEIALHLYEEHGERFAEHLRGEFAIVVWDERRRRLVVARDRFGVKPLCYARLGDGFVVGSEAKALFAAGVEAAWDHEALLVALSAQYVPPGRTLFRGVRQVRPGCVLVVDAKSGGALVVSERRYWDLAAVDAAGRAAARSPADARRAIAGALDDAVRVRLRADVAIACHLSGGVDSSTIAALAARHAGAPITCFSVGFAGRYDESAAAAATAARLGARLEVVRVDDRALAEALGDAVYAAEGLAINGHLAAKHVLSARVRDAGFKIVLTGEGADEVFCGYPHFQRDVALSGGAVASHALAAIDAAAWASAGIMVPRGEALPTAAMERRLGFVPAFLAAKATFGHRMRSLLAPELRAHADALDPFAILAAEVDVAVDAASGHRRSRLRVARHAWIELALANYILRTLGDGTEMAHSIEGRLPFLDHHVVAAAAALPDRELATSAVAKPALRAIARPLVGERTAARPKHPFYAPPLGGDMLDLLADTLTSAPPLFCRRALSTLVDRTRDATGPDRVALDAVAYTVLTACLLDQRLRLSPPDPRWATLGR